MLMPFTIAQRFPPFVIIWNRRSSSEPFGYPLHYRYEVHTMCPLQVAITCWKDKNVNRADNPAFGLSPKNKTFRVKPINKFYRFQEKQNR